tara:strand:- start:119 stop:283 length:165 start_codon:yes stop_codon:yes gene_type:complete
VAYFCELQVPITMERIMRISCRNKFCGINHHTIMAAMLPHVPGANGNFPIKKKC